MPSEAGSKLQRVARQGDGGQSQSTLAAAQIVTQLAQDGGRRISSHKNNAIFQQLLDECLRPQGTEQRSILDEGDSQLISKVISLTVVVGFDSMLKESALSNRPDAPDQLMDCFDVIALAIQKSPEVLSIEVDRAVFGTQENGPLILLLMSRIIRISCVYYQNNTVLQKIERVILTLEATGLASGLPDLRQLCHNYSQMCSSVVDYVTSSLKTIVPKEPFLGSYSAQVQIHARLRTFKNPREMDKMLEFGFVDGVPAISLSLLLVKALLQSHIQSNNTVNVMSALGSRWSWGLNSIRKLWAAYSLIEPYNDADIAVRGLLLKFIEILEFLLHDASYVTALAAQMIFNLSADILSTAAYEFEWISQTCLGDFIQSLLDWAQGAEWLVSCCAETFVPIVAHLRADGEFFKASDANLQNIIESCLQSFTPRCHLTEQRVTSLIQDRAQTTTDDMEIYTSSEQRRKRRRISREDEHVDHDLSPSSIALVEKIITLLTTEDPDDVEKFPQMVIEPLAELREYDQCYVIDWLGRSSCTGTSSRNFRSVQKHCSFCDAKSPERLNRKVLDGSEGNKVCQIIDALLATPEIWRQSKKVRIAIMLAIGRLVNHSNNDRYLTLDEDPPFGRFCLQSLQQGSSRELRIAAGRALKSFCHPGVGLKLSRANSAIALDFLNELCERKDPVFQETSILALGSIGAIWVASAFATEKLIPDSYPADRELNKVLVCLVTFFGSSNPVICGLAYNELVYLAQAQNMTLGFTLKTLLEPFWPNVALIAINKLQSEPQIARNLYDALDISVSQFLYLYRSQTIPFLVYSKRQDILKRIALSMNPPTTVGKMCSERTNMAAILAYLLRQSLDAPEQEILNILAATSSDFIEENLSSLIKTIPTEIAAELLKYSADAGEAKESEIQKAFSLLSALTFGKTIQSKASSKKGATTGQFFETHVLGIMALFSDVMNELHPTQPLPIKRRCLRAIAEMIKFGRSNISRALPQISACLRSAIQMESLCDDAFAAWAILLSSLKKGEVDTFIDQTFALISHSWRSFNSTTLERANTLIEHLFTKHEKVIERLIKTIPSLNGVPGMSDFENKLQEGKTELDPKLCFQAFIQRLKNENAVVVEAAFSELVVKLEEQQAYIHEAAINIEVSPLITDLVRAILDSTIRFNEERPDIANVSAKCLGLIGSLDPSKAESVRETKNILVLSNFESLDETVEFVFVFLEEIVVNIFLLTSNTRVQGFLAFAMQELLKFCNLGSSDPKFARDTHSNSFHRWLELPDTVRNTLIPFLTSKYVVTAKAAKTNESYPLYDSVMSHSSWLRRFTQDLLQKAQGGNVGEIFSVCSKIIRGQDLSISSFLLPYAALNLVINGIEDQRISVGTELRAVLEHPMSDLNHAAKEQLMLCSESVFQVLDYFARWLHEKKKQVAAVEGSRARTLGPSASLERDMAIAQSQSIEKLLTEIPANVISRRAVECKSYYRALFHYEQFIRQEKAKGSDKKNPGLLEPLYEGLQNIYSKIDEPDGIEGISTELHILDIDQQILQHRKAGRWTAAQSWYELILNKEPSNINAQINLLSCLRESGQHDVLLNQFDSFRKPETSLPRLLPYVTEAAWVTGKWDKLAACINLSPSVISDFNLSIGAALVALYQKNICRFNEIISGLREHNAESLTYSNTASLQVCHEISFKLHVLTELESMSRLLANDASGKAEMLVTLDRRLDIMGAFLSDKQYLLGIRRAVMQLSPAFTEHDIAASWLTSARLARKGDFKHQAYNAILHAAQLGDKSATIEHARLLWDEGNHRQAIQNLKGAIETDAFGSHHRSDRETSETQSKTTERDYLAARAHLMLGKWMDKAGQGQSDEIISQYRVSTVLHNSWEKGHYYLGKHYNKLLESEKVKPHNKQAERYASGEVTTLVIASYIRALNFGGKYIFQTVPRILTLWLDLGSSVMHNVETSYGNSRYRKDLQERRKHFLGKIHDRLKRYLDYLPAFVFYPAFSQIVARICHENNDVYNILRQIVVKVVSAHPQQALWTLLAVAKSSSKARAYRGVDCLSKIQENSRGALAALINHGQRLSTQLLRTCEFEIPGRVQKVSLSKDLGFNHKIAPCKLVIPVESALVASLPMSENVNMSKHQAFPREQVTISAFLDDVLVMQSLQKPRKICVRGSDGKIYGLLCKPKDDLRKDQRLMEFNSMINRLLRRDAESSKRRLYIKTYAVTPLNEECGIIEWVDNLRTLRSIIEKYYTERNISIAQLFPEAKRILDEICDDGGKTKLHMFHDKLLPLCPSVFHEWFVEMFPEPGVWFAARLKYTRSCAVISMIGVVLGLGDRHTENILFEEDTGGTFHVDFNCLFDKGLTLEKAEKVPFRLTHNMIDAFGCYGYEGPFRKSCELTMKILRQNEDSLITILETFVYDPTTDFMGTKPKKHVHGVPDTPQEVLESVGNKLKGLLPNESVPLSVGGYVDILIQQATDTYNLAQMYVGWMAFI